MPDDEHNKMMAEQESAGAVAGMRLDGWMFPFCLEGYAGTPAHWYPTPADHLDWEKLGYVYEDYYEVP